MFDAGLIWIHKTDDGVYENVTVRNKDSRLFIRDKPETLPDLKNPLEISL